MDDAVKERAKEILLDHRGADDPITSRELSERLTDADEVGSFPETRFLVRNIVLEDQIPVASTQNGYFVIEHEQELEEYVDNLEQRILGISERKFAVQRAANEWGGDIETDEDLDLL
jgi:ABC-type uncharacterized transport system ATPase subunit